MTDRLAFWTLIALAGVLTICLGCVLAAPLKMAWLVASFWLICCSLLVSQMAMPMPATSSAALIASASSGLLLGLMVGSSALAAWRLGRATRCLTRLTQAACLPNPAVVTQLTTRLKLQDSVVVVASQAPFSFCYGLWRPRICLSLGLVEALTEAELAAVLGHEAYHLRRREPLRMAVVICLSRFLFFAPLIAELRDRYLAEKELTADRAAVAIAGRASLAGAMHKLMTMDKQPRLLNWVAVAGLSVTAHRVDRLLNPTAKLHWFPSWRSIVTTFIACVASCLLMVMG